MKIRANELVNFMNKFRFGSQEVLVKMTGAGLYVKNSVSSEVGIEGFLKKDAFEEVSEAEFVVPELRLFNGFLKRFRTDIVRIEAKEYSVVLKTKRFRVELPVMKKEFFKPFAVKPEDPMVEITVDAQKLKDLLSVLMITKADNVLFAFDGDNLVAKVSGLEKISADMKLKHKIDEKLYIQVGLKSFLSVLSQFVGEITLFVFKNYLLVEEAGGIANYKFYFPAIISQQEIIVTEEDKDFLKEEESKSESGIESEKIEDIVEELKGEEEELSEPEDDIF